MILRKATMEDCKFIYNLRNQLYVRNASWDTEIIDYSEHENWFKNNFKYYYIINDNKGFIRVKDGEVSIAILEEQQNKGLGTSALKEITNLYPNLKAEVKLDNLKSLYFFINAGFKPIGLILQKFDSEEDKK